MQNQGTMIVTGGSRGIGQATAISAAKQGWNIVVNYQSNERAAQKTVSEIEKVGGNAICVAGDVCSESDMQRLFDVAIQAYGSIDAVIINAGIVAPSLSLAEMEVERIRKVIDVNLVGAMICARQAAIHMPENNDGENRSITFVSSAASRHGSPFEYVDYAATKGAIDTLVIGLSKELAVRNIRVNAVRPGIIDTEIHASGGQPDRAAKLSSQLPMKRAGTAQEVADAILWLASKEASYTTGSLLDVAGGR